MRVALFVPCFVDVAAPHVARDAVTVLERLGCTVDYPGGQTCCGQPAWSAGATDEARVAAERLCEVFADHDRVVQAPEARSGNYLSPAGNRNLGKGAIQDFTARSPAPGPASA